jgi:hypothetical protein
MVLPKSEKVYRMRELKELVVEGLNKACQEHAELLARSYFNGPIDPGLIVRAQANFLNGLQKLRKNHEVLLTIINKEFSSEK